MLELRNPLIIPKPYQASRFSFVQQTASIGIFCVAGLMIVFLLRIRGEYPILKNSDANNAVQALTDAPSDEIELTETHIPKRLYVKIVWIMMFLLFLANIDALIEITTEKWMVQKFGVNGFSSIMQFSLIVALPVKIAALLLLFVFRKPIMGNELSILYGCTIYSAIYWIALPFVDFEGVLWLIFFSYVAGALIIVSISGLMMKFVPKKRSGEGYQLFTLWYNIPLMILPGVGNILYIIFGHEVLFFFIAGVIIALIIPLLRRLDRLYARIRIE